MSRGTFHPRSDALKIWRSGVDAVLGSRLIQEAVAWKADRLTLGDREWDLPLGRRVVVLGAGKAAASMVDGLLLVLQPFIARGGAVQGWVNAVEGSFDQTRSGAIRIHPARPPSVNEPTQQAWDGTQSMLRMAAECRSTDLVIVLISGGASALMPAPIQGLTLEDKRWVTRWLSQSGADIEQLNTVRRALSQVKAGGLARRCRAHEMISLVLSDVLGDDLATIGSGPTLLEPGPDPAKALEVLADFQSRGMLGSGEPDRHARIVEALGRQLVELRHVPRSSTSLPRVTHRILGNNTTAVDAAGRAAVELGHTYWLQSARRSEGDVLEVADSLAKRLLQVRHQGPPTCWILGGEPSVNLPPESTRGKGGRNQSLVLAVMQKLMERVPTSWFEDFALVSGGTDGEDGPTDAAGAYIDAEVIVAVREQGLDAAEHLSRHDAYPFFERAGGLLKTGPTHTNVCDLRVVILGWPG